MQMYRVVSITKRENTIRLIGYLFWLYMYNAQCCCTNKNLIFHLLLQKKNSFCNSSFM